MTENLREINGCEVCGNAHLESVLNLGLHPMCDDLVPIGDARICKEYPIEILYCPECKTAHQRFQIPKEQLFPQTYHYRSKNTADVLSGMEDLVLTCVKNLGKLSNKKILDIGCNDGSLLGFFREKGANTFGFEPTRAYLDAQSAGHTVIHDFFTEETAQDFVAQHGYPDVITFTNVFAHIEDLGQILRAINILRHPETTIVIENHYLGAIFKRKQFDTFYHEHPRTYSYGSFVKIAENLGMNINLVEFPSRYGGNIRVLFKSQVAGKKMLHHRVEEIQIEEENFAAYFHVLAAEITDWRKEKSVEIASAVSLYGALVAKAFPGRAAIPLKMLGLDQTMVSAVYEKPQSDKIGHYVPGTRIPILSDVSILLERPEGSPILNLAWHIDQEIKGYMQKQGYEGQYINII
ncbi:MAG: methyltransferase domain-containing protein [Gammaproteobacteria bacterium]|nr:methyltransferase domain-containing protein [Gammaproteobacteria bacterium]